MQIVGRRALLMLILVLAGCNRAPSKAETLAALRASNPALDTIVVNGRVWQDGPPWFSCAEVISKFDGRADRATVRDEVGNWKSLVVSGLAVLRDSAKGTVADPGWCTVKLTDEGARRAATWAAGTAGPFPTGSPRRGWTMPVGRRRVVVEKAHAEGRDSATAQYLVTVQPNDNGIATGAARDTSHYVATLRRIDGGWQVAGTRAAAMR
jgi:hypothetical protein